MIVGRLDRWRECVGPEPIWAVAFEALLELTPEAAEKGAAAARRGIPADHELPDTK